MTGTATRPPTTLGQGALHAGNDHDHPRRASRSRRRREQAVEPGDAHVEEPVDAAAHDLGGDRGLLGHRDIRGARAGDETSPRPAAGPARRRNTMARASGWNSASGTTLSHRTQASRWSASPAGPGRARRDRLGDRRNLCRRLAGAEHDFGEALPAARGGGPRGRSPRSSNGGCAAQNASNSCRCATRTESSPRPTAASSARRSSGVMSVADESAASDRFDAAERR